MRKNMEMLSDELLADFFSELGMLTDSGITLSLGLSLLAENTSGERERQLYKKLILPTDAGDRLSDTMERAGDFPKYACDMVRVGEASGTLSEVFCALGKYYLNRDALRRRIRGALVYPLGMTLMVLCVIVVLLTQVMPVFQRVFAQLGLSMNAVAGGFLSIGNAVSGGIWWILGIIAAVLIIAAVGALVPAKGGGDALIRLIPGSKRLRRLILSDRFCYSMALMIKSGIVAREALLLAAPIMGNKSVKREIEEMVKRMDEGASFQTVITAASLVPARYKGSLAVAFQTGDIGDALETVSDQVSAEADERLDRTVSVLEPTLVMVLCIMVGAVLLSVMLPLMSALTGM